LSAKQVSCDTVRYNRSDIWSLGLAFLYYSNEIVNRAGRAHSRGETGLLRCAVDCDDTPHRASTMRRRLTGRLGTSLVGGQKHWRKKFPEPVFISTSAYLLSELETVPPKEMPFPAIPRGPSSRHRRVCETEPQVVPATSPGPSLRHRVGPCRRAGASRSPGSGVLQPLGLSVERSALLAGRRSLVTVDLCGKPLEPQVFARAGTCLIVPVRLHR